ncbi:MAG: cytochrome c [Anaerolineae bacterium]|nr:cytochrome c [Anaerolineae bacterium]
MSRRIWISLSLALFFGLLLSACGPGIAPNTSIPTLAPREATSAPAEAPATVEGAEATSTPEATTGDVTEVAAVSLEEAAAVYAASCQGCHGADGQNGTVGPSLAASAEVAALSDDELRDIVHNGVEGTAMRAFGDELSDAEIEGLIDLIRSWEGGEGGAAAETPEATAEPTTAPEAAAEADLEAGLSVYAANCQACHGAEGQNAVVGPDLFANPDIAAMDHDAIRDIVVNGVEGTAMQAFGDRLSDEEIDNVVALIESWQE